MRPKRRAVCLLSLCMTSMYLLTNLMIYEFSNNTWSRDEFKEYSVGGTEEVLHRKIQNSSNTERVMPITTPVKDTLTTEAYKTNFSYPLSVAMVKLVQEYRRTGYVKQEAINPFRQRYLHNPTKTCRVDTRKRIPNYMKDVFLLFVVKSKCDHSQQRIAIRQTWGNEHNLKGVRIKTVFVLGTPVNDSLHLIWNEIKRYNDIILMDFHDTYFNNTLKTSTAFNWITEFCPYARFIVLIDDDFFVSLNTLISYLYTLLVDNRKYLYMGRLFEGYEPHRNASSKWYVPVSEYPWTKYPPFIAAGTVIMTMDFVSDVRTAMQYTKPFRLDDVYLAIVAYKLGVTPIHNAEIYEYPTLNKNCIASHGYTPERLTLRWSFYKRFLKMYNDPLADH